MKNALFEGKCLLAQNLCHEAGSWRTNCAMKLLLGSHEAGSWQLSGAMRQVHGIFLVP